MMSVLEYLEHYGVHLEDMEERMWWIGWEDAHCMGRAYDGWSLLRGDDRYEKFASLAADYIVYCRACEKNVSDHYVMNTPGMSYEDMSFGNQRMGGVV